MVCKNRGVYVFLCPSLVLITAVVARRNNVPLSCRGLAVLGAWEGGGWIAGSCATFRLR